MAATKLEKKGLHLGTWKSDSVADNIVKEMAEKTQRNKGRKVKIRFTKEGVSLTKHFILVGSSMTDYIPFRDLYYVTVNRYHPKCLLIVAHHRHYRQNRHDYNSKKHKDYQILAFKMESELDVGYFVNFFKELRNATKHAETHNNNIIENRDSQNSESVNWTLKTKKEQAEKRQLSTMVDIKINGDGERNGYHSDHTARAIVQPQDQPEVTIVTREVYPYDSERQTVAVQAKSNVAEPPSDNVSQTSESLRDELDTLSHELRDIKFMLEKSTGIGAEEYHNSPRRQDQKPIDAVVLHHEDEDDNVFKHESKVVTNGRSSPPVLEGEVRVQVPDYRSYGTQTYQPHYRGHKVDSVPTTTYGQWKGETLRANPANSKIWREEVVLRQGIPMRAVRPRSQLYSTSSYGSTINGSAIGSVRGPKEYVLVERPANKVYARPGTTRRIATNVHKPIEKVYTRPHSIHGNVYRHIVAEKAPIYYTSDVDFNQNHVRSSVTDSEVSPREAVIVKY